MATLRQHASLRRGGGPFAGMNRRCLERATLTSARRRASSMLSRVKARIAHLADIARDVTHVVVLLRSSGNNNEKPQRNIPVRCGQQREFVRFIESSSLLAAKR